MRFRSSIGPQPPYSGTGTLIPHIPLLPVTAVPVFKLRSYRFARHISEFYFTYSFPSAPASRALSLNIVNFTFLHHNTPPFPTDIFPQVLAFSQHDAISQQAICFAELSHSKHAGIS